MTWIQIGPAACDDDLLPHVRNTTFYDIFNVAEPTDEWTCPAGYTSVKTAEKLECLHVKVGRELLASRFETRRYVGGGAGQSGWRHIMTSHVHWV